MKKRALRKDFYMEIRKSLNRFLSILLIVALGVAFYSGIQSAAPDMRYSGDEYFDEHRLMDLKVIGTLGLTEDDIEALSQVDGVAAVEPGYMTDVLCGEEIQSALRLESISPTMNQLTATEGRLPEKAGECFVDIEFLDECGYEIGDNITFYLESEDDELPLKRDTFTIVGAGSSPLYIAFSRGNTTLGTGELSGAAYILPEDFDYEVYTQAYIEVSGARDLTAYTDAYDTLIAKVMDSVEEIEGARCEIRYQEVMDEAEQKLADARQELEDGRAEGESELAEAESEIADAEKELEDGRKELEDARQELADGEKEIEDGEKELQDSKETLEEKAQELEDGKAQLADGWAQLQSGKNELASQEASFNKQYKSAMKEITSGEQQLADAKKQLAAGREEYEAGLAQYEEGRAQYEAGEQQYAAGLAELETQEAAWPGQKQELEAQRAELAKNQTALEAALPQMNTQLSELQTQQAEAQAQRDSLQSQLDTLNGQISSLQQTESALQAEKSSLQEQITSLNSQIDSSNASISELNTRLASLDGEISSLTGRRDSLNAQIAEEKGKETPDTDKIASLEAELSGVQQSLDSKTSQRADAQSSLDSASMQLSQAQSSLAGAQSRLEAIPSELSAVQANLAQCQAGAGPLTEGIAQADAGLTQINDGVAALQAEITTQTGNLEQVKAGIAQIDSGISQAESGFAAGRQQLAESRAQLDAAKQQLDETLPQLNAAKEEIESGEEEIAANEQKLKSARRQLADGRAQIASAKQTIAANEQTLIDSQAQIEDGERQLADGRQQIADAEKEIEDAKQELEDGKKEIADAEKELADGEQELADGKKEYEDGKKEFEEEIADAEQKIADAEEEIADIKTPEWTVSDRGDLPDNIGYGENADRMRNLGQVFPVLFFLVAALISLTTMTRMVEEERTQIGTLKALGYSKMAIAAKYLSYALIATLGGSVLGILLGEKFLPYVIVTAYRIMYQHMSNIVLPYNMKYALIATGAALFSTMFATLAACYRTLADTPAVLMRPPAPKEGKRVLLEKIPFLWKHLSFSWKSTVRNLFRYKKRFFMTIFGIGGCMALMIVGYGLRDSIMDIANLQYRELQIYDGMVILDTDEPEEEQEALETAVAQDTRVEDYTRAMMRKDIVRIGEKNWDLYLMVPEDIESFQQFVNFRDRNTGEEYELTDEGAIITEKIATELNLKAGDTVAIENDDYGTVEVPVAAVTENYLSHYIYISPALYEKCYGEEPQYDQILFRSVEKDTETITQMGEDFMTYKAALSISYTETLMEQVTNMLSALDSVIVVLIISAGLLAFVVLYNLNNININERKRELATIKVLGFYDGEVDAYVYRENVLLTLIGIFVGVGLGIVLHRFVIVTVEVDYCMFGRNINLPSFLVSAAFTVVFSAFVNFIMHFKLKKIDMVESLKSVE
ncbi:efflux ABC transporter, permease protein [Marvinbryantia formatexigens DSM 14469]|uniref:Efflux ABC transporter, permease protein n=1 Tax=Marvinbryantia formatexigens DSM 14469 TaxID=478749 RepID=C6LI63_9FIRM|nr:FtsX-like permease family protein [Marvinbryantia formatexigens]EET59718.1 efflux ABC transporter, permease protein [Marvinbryantia formatexigens DSM 14469]UWO26633.1 FtsX-like permease family protein [Marvinbryantia formatexigens DSM 14469]SDG46351.1 putative ABC transport system permease protein [Marvinbryantia formatexigens]